MQTGCSNRLDLHPFTHLSKLKNTTLLENVKGLKDWGTIFRSILGIRMNGYSAPGKVGLRKKRIVNCWPENRTVPRQTWASPKPTPPFFLKLPRLLWNLKCKEGIGKAVCFTHLPVNVHDVSTREGLRPKPLIPSSINIIPLLSSDKHLLLCVFGFAQCVYCYFGNKY